MSLTLLKESMKKAPIIKKGSYSYLIHPITDGIPEINPELLRDITQEMRNYIIKYLPIDKIVTMEAMGIPLATDLSLLLHIPFTVIRKRQYNLPDEKSIHQLTGYSKSNMFINGLKTGDKIVIVDDVLSTGGTLRAVISALKKMGVIIKAIIIAINKGRVVAEIRDEYGIPITCLLSVDVIDDKVIIKEE